MDSKKEMFLSGGKEGLHIMLTGNGKNVYKKKVKFSF